MLVDRGILQVLQIFIFIHQHSWKLSIPMHVAAKTIYYYL